MIGKICCYLKRAGSLRCYVDTSARLPKPTATRFKRMDGLLSIQWEHWPPSTPLYYAYATPSYVYLRLGGINLQRRMKTEHDKKVTWLSTFLFVCASLKQHRPAPMFYFLYSSNCGISRLIFCFKTVFLLWHFPPRFKTFSPIEEDSKQTMLVKPRQAKTIHGLWPLATDDCVVCLHLQAVITLKCIAARLSVRILG